MLGLIVEKKGVEKTQVITIYYNVNDVPIEVEGFMFQVDELPAKEDDSKNAMLFINSITGVCWWEYTDPAPVQKTQEQIVAEKIEQLEADVATANYALMMGGLI